MLASLTRVARVLSRARTLEARERWSRDRLEAHQRVALGELVRHVAERSAFWRRHWNLAPGDLAPGTALDPRSLPAVTRAAIMQAFDDAVTDPRLRRDAVDAHLTTMRGDALFRGDLRVMASSGSTGERGRFVYDAEGWTTFLASCLRWTRWMGVTPRLPRLRTAAIGAPDGKHMTYRGAASLDIGVFDSLRLSATDPLESIVAALDGHRPDALNAYPSILALLAEEKLAGRLRASPRILCTSSEQRTADVTARIEHAFGVRPHDCYALTETGITALDCREHAGLHVFEDLSIVEIVDAHGQPAAPGAVGARALVTNLYNRALPMIRVEVSDLLVALPGPCACGRAFRRLAAVEGRADDVLTLRGLDGAPRRVHPIHLRTKLAACAEVVQYRASFEGSTVLVEVVIANGTRAEDATRSIDDALAAFVRDQSLAPLSLVVRALDRVPREPGGKLKVVRQLPREGADGAPTGGR